MSELIYYMKCPSCGKRCDFMFGGSGRHGECMNCGHKLPPNDSYEDYEGTIISYNGI